MTVRKKKLIEVALPLEAINKASAKEKSIRHGHPSTLHLWWARRPLAAARAVIFAQMVDDPSAHPDVFPTEKAQEKERQRLFRIIEDMVRWENTTNERVLQAARDQIWQSWRSTCADFVDHPQAKTLFNRNKLPGFHDPFAGGGALPLEAQRLGLDAFASDLNPVAVLLNKGMVEVPARCAGLAPVNPVARQDKELAQREWQGARGLAEDVRYYAKWARDEAEKRIGNLYPPVKITAEVAKGRPELKPLLGEEVTVIAWLWARTVKSPNPAFSKIDVPLASTFLLSTKPGKEAYVLPEVEAKGYRFTVRAGKPKPEDQAKSGTKLSRGANFRCLMSGAPIASDYIYSEAMAGRMGSRLLAAVVETKQGRAYLSPTTDMEAAAREARPSWKPDVPMPDNARWFSPPLYGLRDYGDLFTNRQLVALTTFSDLAQEARERVTRDALQAGMKLGDRGVESAVVTAQAYADAIAMYLAFAVSKAADRNSSLCFWESAMDRLRGTFGRQALPMVWDYAETNPFAGAGGDIYGTAHSLCEVLDNFRSGSPGHVEQQDARRQSLSAGRVISTDPPYYDNIGYADLSDFFYVWLRRTLQPIFPDLFATVAVPKADELIATPHRHGGKEKAEAFFLAGMTDAMHRLAEQAHPAFPVTIYYAFKQSENDGEDGTASTGWETFLDAVIRAGFAVSGTWPMRTELTVALKKNIGALASSIVLVCRPRPPAAPSVTRREFVAALKTELPGALAHLQKGNIAPVDLAQAAIGPGMAVFTRFAKVLDAQGKPLAVRDALTLINQTLDEALAEQEGDFDADSRWALAWFEQFGFADGEYGVAETLSTAKNTSVMGLEEAGILKSGRGKVRLLKASELPANWDPATDPRLTAWEVVHYLIRALDAEGELGAAALVAKLGTKAEVARELAYRLYTLCERKKRATEALAYNGLVQSWPEIMRLAREGAAPTIGMQGTLFSKDEG